MIARRMQQFTDFGELKIENDQGRTSLILRAGSNQTTETGLDEQHWTIRLDLGATGDILDFKITEPEGRLLFRLHAGSNGQIQIYGDGGVDLSSGNNGSGRMRHDVIGDHATAITGDMSRDVKGNVTTTVEGAVTSVIANDDIHTIGRNCTVFIGGDNDIGISGSATQAIAGARKTQIGKDDETTVDGNVKIAAKHTATIDGKKIKLGALAGEPVIKGHGFQSAVMARLGSAGSVASIAAQTATATLAPDVFAGDATGLTVTAVATLAAAVAQIGTLLTTAAGAYNTTLSTKVDTE